MDVRRLAPNRASTDTGSVEAIHPRFEPFGTGCLLPALKNGPNQRKNTNWTPGFLGAQERPHGEKDSRYRG